MVGATVINGPIGVDAQQPGSVIGPPAAATDNHSMVSGRCPVSTDRVTAGVTALINAARKNPAGLHYDTSALENSLNQIIHARSTLRLVLPTFHGKSPRREWTASDLPDQGDVLAARTLVELHRHIADIYPDTHLYLLSEGHLYADVEALGDDYAVSAYVDAVRAMFAHCDGISVIDATELLPSGAWEHQRKALLERYCPSVEEIQERVSVELRYLELYNGYKKLYLALLSSPGPGPRYGQGDDAAPSRMALRRRAKELALMQLRQYVGFARLVATMYGPEPYVKLSALYKALEITDQVGINLISGNHQRATPSFHSVCLEADGSYRFIKAYKAREAGYALVANRGLPMFVTPSGSVGRETDVLLAAD